MFFLCCLTHKYHFSQVTDIYPSYQVKHNLPPKTQLALYVVIPRYILVIDSYDILPPMQFIEVG